MTIETWGSIFVQQGIMLLFMVFFSLFGFALSQTLKLWRFSTTTPLTKATNPIIDNIYLKWFFSLSLSLAATMTLLFILGIVGLFYANLMVLFAFGITFWSLFVLKEPIKAAMHHLLSIRDLNVFLVHGFKLLFLLTLYLYTMHQSVKVPGAWDDLMYHLPFARSYIEHHAIVFEEYYRFSLGPQNYHLIISLGLMFGHETLAQMLANWPIFIIALGLLGMSQWFFRNLLPALVSLYLFMHFQPMKHVLGYAFIDTALALFCFALTLALLIWRLLLSSPMEAKQLASFEESKPAYNWLVLAGFFGAMAASTKLFGGIFAFMLACYLLMIYRSWRAAFLYSAVVALFGTAWYIRSFLISGDPFHPLGANIFGFFIWNANDLAYQVNEQANIGVPRNILYLWDGLKTAGIASLSLALLGLVLLPFLKKNTQALRYLYLVFVAYFFFWFFSSQVDRYLAPILPLGSFLIVATVLLMLLFCYQKMMSQAWQAKFASFFQRPFAKVVILGVAGLAMLVVDVRVIQSMRWQIANYEAILHTKSAYQLSVKANSLINEYGDKMVNYSLPNTMYYFQGQSMGDNFGSARYGDMEKIIVERSFNEAVLMVLQKFDAKMFAYNCHYALVDPQDLIADFDVQFEIETPYECNVLLTVKQAQ